MTVKNVVVSQENQLTTEDFYAWIRGVAIYSLPFTIILLSHVLSVLPEYLSDNPTLLLIITFIIQQAIGLAEKYKTSDIYKQ